MGSKLASMPASPSVPSTSHFKQPSGFAKYIVRVCASPKFDK